MTIRLLPENEKESVTKEKVLAMERSFLNILDFDLQLLSPQTFLERYLRLSNAKVDDNLT
jgi:hypothetical protein